MVKRKKYRDIEDYLSAHENGKPARRHIKHTEKKHGLSRLDSIVEKFFFEGSDSSLRDVVLQPFNFGIPVMVNDVNYPGLFRLGAKKKWAAIALFAVASLYMYTLPHELIHAGVNVLSGGENQKIVFNTLYGGGIYEMIIPGVQSELLSPLTGAYVMTVNPHFFGRVTSVLAPYAMTPLGVFMALEGKSRRNLPLWAAGAGLVLNHMGGILGDFFSFGTELVAKPAVMFYQAQGYADFDRETGFLTALSLMAASFYVGAKAAGISYKLFRNSIQYVRSEVFHHNI